MNPCTQTVLCRVGSVSKIMNDTQIMMANDSYMQGEKLQIMCFIEASSRALSCPSFNISSSRSCLLVSSSRAAAMAASSRRFCSASSARPNLLERKTDCEIYTILYYTLLYYTLLYSTILYYTMLCHALPYHTILYYIYNTYTCMQSVTGMIVEVISGVDSLQPFP
jgi:hypothetical protein